MKKLKKKLNKSIKKYVKLFESKHDLAFDFWVADLTGTIACFGDYFVNFEDIRLDLEKDIDKEMFFEWYDLTLELGLEDKPTVNYYSYIKGY